MKPNRMTLAEVDAAAAEGREIPLHEWDAAMGWWCLSALLGDGAPPSLPAHPQASESARCAWVFLAEAAGGTRVVPDPIGVLMTCADMPDPLVPPELEPSAWRVLAHTWFDEALSELVARKMAVRLGDGSLILREVP